jgi:uncharacterized protein YjbI with pentapeptide repeats
MLRVIFIFVFTFCAISFLHVEGNCQILGKHTVVLSEGIKQKNFDSGGDYSNQEYKDVTIHEQSKSTDSFDILDVHRANFEGTLFERVTFEEIGFGNCSFRNAVFYGCSTYNAAIKGDNDLTNAIIHIDGYENIYSTDDPSYVFKLPKNCAVDDYEGFFGYDQNIIKTKSYQMRNLSGTSLSLHKTAANGLIPINYGKFDFDNKYSAIDLSNFLLVNTSVFDLLPQDILDNARIRYAKFSNIQLNQLYSTFDYKNCSIIGVDFGRSDFSDADFSGKNLSGCNFSRCNLENANFTNTQITWCNFNKTNFTIEQLKSTVSFKSKKLMGVQVWKLKFDDVDFSGVDLSKCVFVNCSFKNTNFTDAIITGCELQDNDQSLTLEQIKSTWNYKNDYMVNVKLPPEIQKALNEEKP